MFFYFILFFDIMTFIVIVFYIYLYYTFYTHTHTHTHPFARATAGFKNLALSVRLTEEIRAPHT